MRNSDDSADIDSFYIGAAFAVDLIKSGERKWQV